MPVTEQEFQRFSEFVHERLANGGAESLSGLVLEWEAHREADETIDDVRKGLADIEAGLGKPAHDVFAEVRQRLGLAK